jgi:hypothetical protein
MNHQRMLSLQTESGLDVYSSDDPALRNVQNSLHLQEIENLFTSEQVGYIWTIPIGHVDRYICSPQPTMGTVQGRDTA